MQDWIKNTGSMLLLDWLSVELSTVDMQRLDFQEISAFNI